MKPNYSLIVCHTFQDLTIQLNIAGIFIFTPTKLKFYSSPTLRKTKDTFFMYLSLEAQVMLQWLQVLGIFKMTRIA